MIIGVLILIVAVAQIRQGYMEQVREERLANMLLQLRLDQETRNPPELVNPKVARALKTTDLTD